MMTPAETATFAHHDKIQASKRGTVLLVCEPCEVVNTACGGTIKLYPGTHLRVVFLAGGLCCELAMGGRVLSVSLMTQWYHCVEVDA
ncbi:MAG: hypothetical protein KDK03_05025 [Rhodobacteraceae bacterium]|nr:hypothetical protein [Paracoccaceae bacterium]